MNEEISRTIKEFVLNASVNRFAETKDRFFDEPLVGFAFATDPLFTDHNSNIPGGEFYEG